GLVGDGRVRLEKQRALLRRDLRPVLRREPGVVPRVPLLLRGARSRPARLELGAQRGVGDEEGDLLLRRRLHPGMEERLAREIGVLEREHFPLLRGGLLPGLLHLLRRPRVASRNAARSSGVAEAQWCLSERAPSSGCARRIFLRCSGVAFSQRSWIVLLLSPNASRKSAFSSGEVSCQPLWNGA